MSTKKIKILISSSFTNREKELKVFIKNLKAKYEVEHSRKYGNRYIFTVDDYEFIINELYSFDRKDRDGFDHAFHKIEIYFDEDGTLNIYISKYDYYDDINLGGVD